MLVDLAPNGRVAIVEYDERAGGFARTFGHFTPADEIAREMREAGYEQIANHEILRARASRSSAPTTGRGNESVHRLDARARR